MNPTHILLKAMAGGAIVILAMVINSVVQHFKKVDP